MKYLVVSANGAQLYRLQGLDLVRVEGGLLPQNTVIETGEPISIEGTNSHLEYLPAVTQDTFEAKYVRACDLAELLPLP